MHVEVVPLAQMSDELRGHWSNVQQRNPRLAGPCFRPELFSAVAHAHPCIYLAVVEEGPSTGFLPFLRRSRWAIATPVPMCDYQAIVGEPKQHWNIRGMLRKARLAAWDFNCLVNEEAHAGAIISAQRGHAPRVVLDEGFEAYVAYLDGAGKGLRKIKNQLRLAERDHGPVRFVAQGDGNQMLHTILRWKAQRFKRGEPIHGWVTAVLEELRGENGPVSGILSGLYVGDELMAGHFGIRCQGVLHYWFPAFNPAYSRNIPGSLLIYQLLSNLAELGCHTLDFGPGGEDYKQFFKNDVLPLARGCFEVPSLTNLIRKGKRQLRKTVSACRGSIKACDVRRA